MLNFSDSLLEKVRAMPQVTSAAMSSEFPLDKSPAFNHEFLIEGEQANRNEKADDGVQRRHARLFPHARHSDSERQRFRSVAIGPTNCASPS